MPQADAMLRIRVPGALKEQARLALDAMGLTFSDAVRLMLVQLISEQRLPFDVKIPNAATQAAIGESEATNLPQYASYDAMMSAIDAEDDFDAESEPDRTI